MNGTTVIKRRMPDLICRASSSFAENQFGCQVNKHRYLSSSMQQASALNIEDIGFIMPLLPIPNNR